MNILIVGDDLQTESLAMHLSSTRNVITLISQDPDYCEKIANQLESSIIVGDASQPEILAIAGADHCDLLISMLNKDADNLVICMMAKKIFGIKRTIATVANPVNDVVFYRLGIDSVICTTAICTNQIESAIVVHA